MPDAPSFPPQSESIGSLGRASGSTTPIPLEPGTKLPDSLQDKDMHLPQSDKTFGALSGEGTISHILEEIKGSVEIKPGKNVDPETFKSLVLSSAIPITRRPK